jgi:hypothetical protein
MSRRRTVFGVSIIFGASFVTTLSMKQQLIEFLSYSEVNWLPTNFLSTNTARFSELREDTNEDALELQISDDFMHNRIILVNGWLLSVTEVSHIRSQLDQMRSGEKFGCLILTKVTKSSAFLANFSLTLRRYLSAAKSHYLGIL